MTSQKKGSDKGFCPFCGMEFAGDHDNCPFCGQDIRPYKDDLGPILDKIQTATNIDMKSTKVKVATSIVLFLLVFAGALVVLDYMENSRAEPTPEPEPIYDGLVIEIINNGYVELYGDFQEHKMVATPLYEPELMMKFSLAGRYVGVYEKIMWIVQTDCYNSANGKNPFYLTVTKEKTGSDPIETVYWENIDVGKFSIMACCYLEDGTYDVFSGYGTYYSKLDRTYTWVYQNKVNTMEFTMSSDDVKSCLDVDLSSRLDAQAKASMKDYVVDNRYVQDLNDGLKSQYNKTYVYTEEGYADFVLSFVQQCFPEEYDSFNYRVSDYWAYPAEMILNGCGDDEDRAILFCSIMKVAGMDSALISLPETVIAGVNLKSLPSPSGYDTARGVSVTYVVADTSSDLSLGKMRPCYTVSSNGKTFYYNGEEVTGRYSIEEIPSK